MKIKNKGRFTVAVIFILLCIICGSYVVNTAENQTKGMYVLEDGWSIAQGNELPKPQQTKELSDHTFSEIKKGEVILLTRNFSDVPFSEGTMAFDTWHVVVKVFLDDKLIYSRGQEYADRNLMVGNLRHYVNLPLDYQDKQLTIYMTCTEDGAMSGMMPIGVAHKNDTSVYWFNRLFLLLIPAIVVIGIGLVVVVIGIVLYNTHESAYKILVLGAMLFLVGIYSLCRGQFMNMLIPDPQVYNAIEYFSVFLLPVMIVGMFVKDRKRIKSKLVRHLYDVILGVTVAFAFCSTVMHLLNIVHYSACLTVFYVIIISGVICLYIVLLNIMGNDRVVMKLYFSSVVMVMIGAMLAVLAFMFRYTGLNELLHIWKWQEYLFIMFLFIAGFFAATALMLESGRVMYNAMYATMYKEIAYTDALTGLLNRRSFDEELKWLEKNKDGTSYGIICFDLNDLKLFNDTKGHEAGDLLLKSFADVLKHTEEQEISFYRTGGDEFAAIIRNTGMMTAEGFIKQMEQEISKENAMHTDIKISVAYGIAKQDENESVHKVYMLADERMYEKKAEMKSKNSC